MTEEEMQKYANEQEGYEVEFLYEYADILGYSAELKEDDNGKEYYVFKLRAK
ncbi:hypothetical protein [Peribacillus asahii]|nr:hypothetical protein [Peribacillus asahii]